MTVAPPVIDLREEDRREPPSLRALKGGNGVTTSAGPRLVGRSGEMASLVAGLDDAMSGSGRLFLLGGEAGMGKSRLAAELAARARERGARVLEGRCWEAGGAPEYWPWVQSLRSYARGVDGEELASHLGAGAPLLGRLLSELGRPSVPAEAPNVGADGTRFRMFEAVASLLGKAARACPLVVVLDDLQAADAASLLLLRFVADHLGEMPVLVVAIHRDPEPGRQQIPMPALVNELSRQPVSRRFHLVGLAEPDVARFIEDATGVEPSAELVTLVRCRTGGNPLFVGEMVESLIAQGQFRGAPATASWHRAIPAGVHELIGRRLSHLSPDCRRALSLASVVGREFRIDVLTRLVGGSGDELLATLEEAAAMSLVDDVPGRLGRLRFSDPIMRDVLLAEVPAPRRMRLHREAGEALESLTVADSESHLVELAGHFLAAALPGCAAKTVRYALRAAARAARRSAHDDAVRLYQMALEALDLSGTGEESRRCEIMLGLASAQAGAGDGTAAGRTYLQTADLAREHGLAEALARSALGYTIGGARGEERRDRRAALLLEEALAALEDTDSVLRSEVMATLAGGRWGDDRTAEQRVALSRQAVEMARRLGGSATLAVVLDAGYEAVSGPDNPVDRLGIATELISAAAGGGDRERVLHGLHHRCLARLELGDATGARADLDAQVHRVAELDQPDRRWSVAVLQATFATAEGRLVEAEERVSVASALGERELGEIAGGAPAIQAYLLRRHQGRVAEAEELVRSAAGRHPAQHVLRLVLAQIHTELGRPDQARELLEALVADGFPEAERGGEWLFEVALASEVTASLGDVDQAAVLYALLEPYAERNAVSHRGTTGSVARNLGLLAGTCGRWGDAVRHLEAALVVNGRTPTSPWLALTRRELTRAVVARDALSHRTPAAGLLDESSPVTKASRPVDSTEAPPSVFRRDGEYWSVAFGADVFRLRDTKGLGYIAQLLGRPGGEIHPLAMVGGCHAGPTGPRAVAMARGDELGGSGRGDAGEILDARARADYQRRLADLRDDLDEAESWGDAERAARAQGEIDFLAHELSAALGLGGRARRMGSPGERARQSVTKAVKAGLERIGHHSPALGNHLASTIRTGTFCSYTADPRVTTPWQL